MKRYFFIDYENTHSLGLDGYEELNDKDRIYIYSNKDDNISIHQQEEMKKICKVKHFVRTTASEPNALDHMIVFNIATIYERKKPNSVEFIIISKDKGYDAIFDEINKKQHISRYECIRYYLHPELVPEPVAKTNKVSKNKQSPDKNKTSFDKNRYLLVIKRLSFGSRAQRIEDLCRKAKDLAMFHNLLVKEYGERGKNDYKLIKDEVLNKNLNKKEPAIDVEPKKGIGSNNNSELISSTLVSETGVNNLKAAKKNPSEVELFHSDYLRLMSKVDFGSNNNKIKEIMLNSKNENEFKVKLKEAFPNKNYYNVFMSAKRSKK